MVDERKRNFAITQFLHVMSDNDLLGIIKNLEAKGDLTKVCVGGLEKTEKELEHRHILLCFKNKKTLDQVIYIFAPLHVEYILSDKIDNYYHYCLKEGIALYDTVVKKEQKPSINDLLGKVYERLANHEPLREIMKDKDLTPVCIRFYNQLKKIETIELGATQYYQPPEIE